MIAACLLGMLLLKLPIPTPRFSGFTLVAALIVVANLGWRAHADAWLRARAAAGRLRRRVPALRVLLTLYTAGMLIPLALLMVHRQLWDRFPVPIITWAMIWNLLLVGLMSVVSVVHVARALLGPLREALIPERPPAGDDAANTETAEGVLAAPSRREILTGAISLAPLVITTTSAGIAATQSGRFEVRRIQVKLPRLPDRLRGLTITHVSDIHVGRIFRPEHLPYLIDQVNALRSDLVAVTGDIIDHSNEFLEPAIDALAQMEGRYGRFVCMGNHDLIDDAQAFLMYTRQHEPNFLEDEHRTVEIGGERVQIAGLAWSRYDRPTGRDPGHTTRADRALAGTDSGALRLALVHHPHAFDALAERGADLTLAGHTHGGQLMLTRHFGAGNMLFRYVWGLYQRGDAAMYVSSGCGNWFPIRVNAPAELVQIQLV